ncbi:phage tail spike protein [Allofustis seminis]|uniref:phage tail spike protein n=1 Tax=Allofustis seminis TaxID=166939 RepID=UPI000373A0D3|nr:phage tail spike protein [Allofustis seminis]
MILLFDKHEKLMRRVSQKAVRKADHKQTITDEGYLSNQLYVEILNIEDDVLKEVEYLAIPVKNAAYKYFFFWLKDYTTEKNITILQGVDSGIEELRKTPVYDVRPWNSDLRTAARQLVQGTNWTIGYVPEVGKRSTNAYYTDVFTALKKYASVWNVEFQLIVEITNQGIGNRYIEFKKALGKNSGARVVYGHNALEILKEVDRSEVYTALIGRGKGEEVGETSNGGITYGRKINFADVEWKKSKGDPVDKPLGQKYVEIPSLTKRYGIRRNKKLEPKIGFIEFSEEEDKENLLRQTYLALEQTSHPQVMMKTTTAYLNAEIGDKVRVVRPDLGFDYYTRVFEVTYDVLTNKITEIKLGDRLFESQGKRARRILSDTTSKINDSIPGTVEKIVDAMTTADGLNRIFQGEVDPRQLNVKPRVNDLWFKPDPDNEKETILYIWNGEIWKEVLKTAVRDDVERLLKELQKEISTNNSSIEQLRTEQNKRLSDFERSLAGSDSLIQSHILDNEKSFSKITQSLNGIRSEVFDGLGNSKITQLSNLIEQKVSQADVMSIVRQDANNIWNAVTDKSGKVLSEINQYNGSVRIKGDLIHLSGRSLIDNAVIKSSHIQSLTADKINTGTLNAARVNIINLNANKIVGLTSEFLRTRWNAISGGDIEITGNALKTKSPFGYSASLSGGRFEFYNQGNEHLGMMGIQSDIRDKWEHFVSIGLEYGKGFAISKKTAENSKAYTDIMRINYFMREINFYEDLVLRNKSVLHTNYIKANDGPLLHLYGGNFGSYYGLWIEHKSKDLGAKIHIANEQISLVTVNKSGNVGYITSALDSSGFYIQSKTIYNRTYSYSSNMYVTSSGVLGRSTSASKYKLLIEDQFKTYEEQLKHSMNLLKLNVSSWFDKTEAEERAEEMSNPNAEFADRGIMKRHVGLIAEHVRDIGLNEHVTYGADGEVEGIEYDRLWVHLIPIVKEQQKRIERLERKLNL